MYHHIFWISPPSGAAFMPWFLCYLLLHSQNYCYNLMPELVMRMMITLTLFRTPELVIIMMITLTMFRTHWWWVCMTEKEYIPSNMHMVLLCFVLLVSYRFMWCIYPYSSGLLHWHWGTIVPQCQWSNPEGYGYCQTSNIRCTKSQKLPNHNKA